MTKLRILEISTVMSNNLGNRKSRKAKTKDNQMKESNVTTVGRDLLLIGLKFIKILVETLRIHMQSLTTPLTM